MGSLSYPNSTYLLLGTTALCYPSVTDEILEKNLPSKSPKYLKTAQYFLQREDCFRGDHGNSLKKQWAAHQILSQQYLIKHPLPSLLLNKNWFIVSRWWLIQSRLNWFATYTGRMLYSFLFRGWTNMCWLWQLLSAK